jgi:DNA-binding XRE family transcriptional regulator
MNKEEFSLIRRVLGKTQNQIAQILCVSPKAIQSFEQGWRNIPSRIKREMLLLLVLKKSTSGNISPCWKTRGCSDEWKKKCIVWELKAKCLCWYFNGTYCQGQFHRNWEDKIQICKDCKVFQSMFDKINLKLIAGTKNR